MNVRRSQRTFTWAEHGEALMRRRKAWYYQREPRPGVSVIGARLTELALPSLPAAPPAGAARVGDPRLGRRR